MKTLYALLTLPLLVVSCQQSDPSAPAAATIKKEQTKKHTATPSHVAVSATQGVKPYPLKTCLVTDEGLDDWDEQTSIIYKNQTIKLCCKMCVKKFYKSPQQYLNKLPK